MIPWYFLALVLLGLPSLAQAQFHNQVEHNDVPSFDFNHTLQQAHKNILRLELKNAYGLIQKEKARNNGNVMTYVIEDCFDFYKILANENYREFIQLLPQRDVRLTKVSIGDKASPYYLYAQAEIYLHWALLKLKFQDNINALQDIKKAQSLAATNAQRFPDFMPNKRTLGMLNVIMDLANKESRWGGMLLGLGSGSVQKGLEQIQDVIRYGRRNPSFEFNEETQILYALLLLSIGSTDNAHWNALNASLLDYQKSPMAAYILANMCLLTGKSAKALTILQSTPQTDQYQPLHSLEYLKGLCKLYKLDLSADQHFDRYLNNYRGELYIKDAYQKLAWVHILKGNKGQADFCFQNALQKGTTYLAVDALAQAELELKIPTDPVLLRARLLYEGGYYAQAHKELAAKNESQFKSNSHKVEFHYRMGLLNELVQKTDDAAKSYDLAASLGGNENHYYACAAALNAGKIWEKRQDSEKAKRYFQLCLKLKPKLYRTSLHQEAQTRLQKYSKPR